MRDLRALRRLRQGEAVEVGLAAEVEVESVTTAAAEEVASAEATGVVVTLATGVVEAMLVTAGCEATVDVGVETGAEEALLSPPPDDSPPVQSPSLVWPT